MKFFVTILLLSLIVVAVTCQREKFTEIFGFAGYSKPIVNPVSINTSTVSIDLSQYDKEVASVTQDEMQKMVQIVQTAVNKDTGLCTYIINTDDVKQYVAKKDGKILYRVRFMFMVTTGFAFGFGVQADILDGVVINMNTQKLSDYSQAGDGDIFQSYSSIVTAGSTPKLSDLNSLGKYNK
jgi:hypothetical protein